MLTLKGVGAISASVLIGEVGDWRAYSHSRSIEKLAGLNLYEFSSGVHRGNKHISKRGRSLLRHKLYFLSLTLVRKGAAFHEDYQRHLAKGMKKTKALIAISRKLIRVLFAMVRDGKAFEPNHQQGITHP